MTHTPFVSNHCPATAIVFVSQNLFYGQPPQVFPFLLPIRKWQGKKLFYLEMLIDGNKYAKNKSEALLPKTYQIAPVYRSERDKKTCRETGAELYINQCEIGYELPDDIKFEERGA